MSEREKAQQLAAERYRIIAIDGEPSGHEVRNAFVSGYLERTVITPAELEAAAEGIALKGHNDGCFDEVREWEALEGWEREAYPGEYPGMAYEDRDHAIAEARAAFEAIGLRVEGGE